MLNFFWASDVFFTIFEGNCKVVSQIMNFHRDAVRNVIALPVDRERNIDISHSSSDEIGQP